MITIHKYTLVVADDQLIGMPVDAKLLSVQVQHGAICLWALVDTDKEHLSRRIYMRGTGHDAKEAVGSPFIATVQLQGGAIVFHLFDGGEWGVKA